MKLNHPIHEFARCRSEAILFKSSQTALQSLIKPDAFTQDWVQFYVEQV